MLASGTVKKIAEVIPLRSEVEALRKLALIAAASLQMETMYGKKYIVDGELENPLGKVAPVRTIRIIDAGMDFPRLVTAYPFER